MVLGLVVLFLIFQKKKAVVLRDLMRQLLNSSLWVWWSVFTYCLTLSDLTSQLCRYLLVFSIQLVPLFFYGFLSKFLNTLVVCLISGLLVWFLPNNADAGVSYIAYLFDYLIPTSAIAFCALLKPKQLVGQTKKAKFSITLQWFVFIFIPLLIGYFSKVLSGVLFWFNATWGWGKWAYSLIYNLFNFIFDLATMLVIVPVICTTLRVLKEKYYQ
jgi:thiamine transporter